MKSNYKILIFYVVLIGVILVSTAMLFGNQPGEEVIYSDIYEEFAIDEGNASYTLDENSFFKNPTHGDYSIIEGADIYDIQFEKIGRY